MAGSVSEIATDRRQLIAKSAKDKPLACCRVQNRCPLTRAYKKVVNILCKIKLSYAKSKIRGLQC